MFSNAKQLLATFLLQCNDPRNLHPDAQIDPVNTEPRETKVYKRPMRWVDSCKPLEFPYFVAEVRGGKSVIQDVYLPTFWDVVCLPGDMRLCPRIEANCAETEPLCFTTGVLAISLN